MGAQALRVAQAIAAGRIVVGAALFAAPGLATKWVGRDARSPAVHVIVRALGARDAVLGLGTLACGHDRDQLRRWLVAASTADALDLVATLAGPRNQARTPVAAAAAVAGATGIVAAARA